MYETKKIGTSIASCSILACCHFQDHPLRPQRKSKTVRMKQTDFDAVIVGAGFGGIYQLKKLKDLGLSVKVIDSAGDVGVS